MSKKQFKEGKWKCVEPNMYTDAPCNHENPGLALMCEKCNTHRPKDVKFYLPKDSKVITNQEKLVKAQSGPDWKCYHCNYDNRSVEVHCVHCGELRNEEDEKWVNLGGDLKEKKYKKGQTPRQHQSNAAGKNKNDSKKFRISKKWRKGIYIGVALIGVFAIWSYFFSTTSVDVEITGFSWERDIIIEKEKTVIEEDWNIPGGGRLISSETRQSGTEEVYDHSEWDEEPIYEDVVTGTRTVDCGTVDNGNGTFEQLTCEEDVVERQQVGTESVERKVYRTEPVYSTWYVYEIERWFHERTRSTNGKDQNPIWSEYELYIKERVGERREKYTVKLKARDENSKFKNLKYSLSENEWKSMNIGDVYVAKVKRSGEVTSLEKPE